MSVRDIIDAVMVVVRDLPDIRQRQAEMPRTARDLPLLHRGLVVCLVLTNMVLLALIGASVAFDASGLIVWTMPTAAWGIVGVLAFSNMAAGPDPRDWFRDLWNSLHCPDAWMANPEVVALTFTVARPQAAA